MESDNQDLPTSVDPNTRNWRAIGFIFLGLIVASAIVIAIYQLTKSDDNDAAAVAPTTGTSQTATASDTDEVVTPIPQNPSLAIFVEEGTTYVENDGNVTMSDVEVRDAAGTVVCDLGTISPGDRQPCAEATNALSPVSAVGSGPQGQPVEVTLE